MRRETPVREPDLRELRRAVRRGILAELARDIASAVSILLIAACLIVAVYLVLAL